MFNGLVHAPLYFLVQASEMNRKLQHEQPKSEITEPPAPGLFRCPKVFKRFPMDIVQEHNPFGHFPKSRQVERTVIMLLYERLNHRRDLLFTATTAAQNVDVSTQTHDRREHNALARKSAIFASNIAAV